MSFLFDAALYTAAIVSVLALYGSTFRSSRKSATVADLAPSADLTLADFKAAPALAELPVEELFALAEAIAAPYAAPVEEPEDITHDALVAESSEEMADVIVPFRRKAPDLKRLTVIQLRKLAAGKGIPQYWLLKKGALLEALSAA